MVTWKAANPRQRVWLFKAFRPDTNTVQIFLIHHQNMQRCCVKYRGTIVLRQVSCNESLVWLKVLGCADSKRTARPPCGCASGSSKCSLSNRWSQGCDYVEHHPKKSYRSDKSYNTLPRDWCYIFQLQTKLDLCKWYNFTSMLKPADYHTVSKLLFFLNT